ncbi:MAG: GAF domain-containing protein [Caldilineae bacterium]|nr:MAG: GAF domain-containing protein [Caldilineae bacterium]
MPRQGYVWLDAPVSAEALRAAVAGAVERRQLLAEAARLADKEAELQQRNEELDALNAIAAAINQTRSLNQVLETALRQIDAALGLPYSEIWLLDRKTNLLRPRIHYGLPESFAQEIPAFKVGVGLPGVVAQTRHPLLVPDLATNPNYMRQRAMRFRLKSALGIPLLSQERVVGVMNFFSYGKIEFTPEIIASLQTIGHLVGTAIENARLFDELQRQTRELSGLYETALATGSVLDMEMLLQRFHEQVQYLLAPDAFAVALCATEAGYFRVALATELGRDLTHIVQHRQFSLQEGGLTGWVIQHQTPLLIRDMEAERTPVSPKHITRPARSWLGVPLIARGETIGAVSVQSFRPHAFDASDRRFLEGIAGQVAIAMENARLFEAERRRRQEIEVVQRLGMTLTASLNLRDVLDAVLSAVLKLMPAQNAHIFLYNGEQLTFGAAMWMNGARDTPYAHPRPDGLTGTVARTGEVIAVSDMQNHPLFQNTPPDWQGAIVGIPLKIGKTVVGVMNIAYPRPRPFPPAELRLLTLLANQAAIAIQNARLFEQAQQEIAERKRTEDALRESEEKYRNLIEQSSDAILLVYNERILLINRKFTELFGYTLPELQTPAFSLLNLAAPRSRSRFRQILERIRQGSPIPTRLELTALSRDGREFEVDVALSPLAYRDGTAVQSTVRDITEQKRIEARLREAQKMEAVGQLAGGIAHDFNNILTAINGLTSIALETLSPGEALYKDLQIIHNQARRAAKLVRQLLTFARQQPAEIRPIHLNQVITELTDLLKRAIGADVDLITNLAPDLRPIQGDLNALEQILTNLCLNARDAMPRGGKLIIQTQNIHLSEEDIRLTPEAQPGEYGLLTVTDTGKGMPPEILTRIFDPFFTTKEVGQGSGLGLAMVFGLMKQLGGFVEVESIPGKGSTFKLFFRTSKQETKPSPPEAAPSMVGGQETILLVEDDLVLCKLVSRILKNVGYTVLTAANGEEGLHLIQSGEAAPHLIIADIITPKMTGPQLYEAVRSLPLPAPPKFIFISGYETENIQQYFPHGIPADSQLINKPFSPPMLASKIREVLDAP